jgi:hypothetical protein
VLGAAVVAGMCFVWLATLISISVDKIRGSPRRWKALSQSGGTLVIVTLTGAVNGAAAKETWDLEWAVNESTPRPEKAGGKLVLEAPAVTVLIGIFELAATSVTGAAEVAAACFGVPLPPRRLPPMLRFSSSV